MPAIVRIFIDSVLDRERVRVLISSKEHKEEAHIITKKALARLLSRRTLTKRPEGQVYTIDAPWNKIVAFLNAADVSKIKIKDIPKKPPAAPIVPKSRDITDSERKRIREIHRRMRKRGGGRR